MSVATRAVDAVDVNAWVDAQLAEIMAKVPPLPEFEPLTSGLCGYEFWDNLCWEQGSGPGLRCTKDEKHAGSCECRGADGTVYGTLRAKTRELRQQIPGGTSS